MNMLRFLEATLLKNKGIIFVALDTYASCALIVQKKCLRF